MTLFLSFKQRGSLSVSVNTLAAPIAFSNRYYRISLLPCQGDQTIFFRLFFADIHEEKE